MGEVTGPQGALKTQGSFSADLQRFIQAFGTRALVSVAMGRKHALEGLLAQLPGVRAACIEVTETGEVAGVHVISDGRLSLAQQRRQVQSALMAAQRLSVDPQRISVVSLRGELQPQENGDLFGRSGPRVRINQLGFEQEGFKVTAHLELEWQGQTFFGFDRDADTAGGRMMASARATLKALENVIEQRAAFFLEGLDTVQNFDRHIAVATVRVVSDLHRTALVGCAVIAENPNYSAAQAVLAALNRSLPEYVEHDGASPPATNGRELEASTPDVDSYLVAGNGHEEVPVDPGSTSVESATS